MKEIIWGPGFSREATSLAGTRAADETRVGDRVAYVELASPKHGAWRTVDGGYGSITYSF